MPAKVEDPVPSAPLWALSYGDMMSLLLTFFILLFSMSTITKEKFTAIAGGLEDALGGTSTPTSDTLDPDEVLKKLLHNIDDNGVTVLTVAGYRFKVTTVREGVKITMGGRALFEEGKAELSEEAKKALRGIAGLLVGYRNRVRVLGHAEPTEASKIDPARFRDLYDLGYERAHVVMEFLEDEEALDLSDSMRVHPARLEAASASWYQMAVSNMGPGQSEMTEEGPVESGKASNRRVEIVVSEELVPWELLR